MRRSAATRLRPVLDPPPCRLVSPRQRKRSQNRSWWKAWSRPAGRLALWAAFFRPPIVAVRGRLDNLSGRAVDFAAQTKGGPSRPVQRYSRAFLQARAVWSMGDGNRPARTWSRQKYRIEPQQDLQLLGSFGRAPPVEVKDDGNSERTIHPSVRKCCPKSFRPAIPKFGRVRTSSLFASRAFEKMAPLDANRSCIAGLWRRTDGGGGTA